MNKLPVLPTFIVFVAVIAGFVGGMVPGQLFRGEPAIAQANLIKPPDVLEAKSFRLLDKDGNQRANLHTSDMGNPQLVFWDQTNHPFLVLGTTDEGIPLLTFIDQKQIARVFLLGWGQDGTPGLVFRDKDGKEIWRTAYPGKEPSPNRMWVLWAQAFSYDDRGQLSITGMAMKVLATLTECDNAVLVFNQELGKHGLSVNPRTALGNPVCLPEGVYPQPPR